MQTLGTPRTFPEITSRPAWETRATEIRQQILVSCGLWPMPEKPPLDARISGRVERDGYSVERVHLRSAPGFYLGGNLYRPLGQGSGPFPAVLNPHGHWNDGRMADEPAGSIPARCISFARQGMIAFSYDMVGYNDTRFADWGEDEKFSDLHLRYGADPADQLWNINEMGLQTWNSIRALDFLEGLPDADPKRLACVGESGGGTQTFMLGAIDDRLAAQVPVVMVSHTMQGGCLCENAPGLRVKHSNMELAAAAAPRPQLMVGAAGDWTKTMMEVEGPAVESVYRLFGAQDQLKYVRFDFGHNFNLTSREAVYDWLGHRFLKDPVPASLKEKPYQKEPDAELRVFPDGKLPADALPMNAFIKARKQAQRDQWQKLLPGDQAGFDRFKELMLPAWRHTLQTDWPDWPVGKDDAVWRERKIMEQALKSLRGTVVILAGSGTARNTEASIEAGGNVCILSLPVPGQTTPRDEFSKHYTTYNRTELQTQVGRLIDLCAALRHLPEVKRVVIDGRGRAGLWALLAAPAADAVAADCGGLDPADDAELLVPGLFAPGLRSIGGFQGAAMLAAPNQLLLHNTQGKFTTAEIEATYHATGAGEKLRISSAVRTSEEIFAWAAQG